MGLLDYLPEDETKRSAALQGILATGLGMMANSYNPGGRFAPALAQGGMAGMQTYGSALENAQQQQVRQMHVQQMTQKAQEEQARRAAIANFRTQLPEQARAMYDIDPSGFLSRLQKENKRYVVGNSLVDDAGTPLYQAPQKDAAPSSLSKLIAERDALPPNHPARKVYDAAINKETTFAPPITVQNYPSPVPIMGPDNKPVLAQFGNKGDVRVTPFTPAPEAKPPTEAESKAAFFASNMKAASQVLDRLESEGMNMAAIGTQAATALSGGAGNLVTSPRAQQARQAQNQWAEQMLRMQTGAAATQDEITRTVSTYFPQIGDSPEAVEQKRNMRRQAENGVFAASGRAQDRVPGQTKARKYNPDTGRIE